MTECHSRIYYGALYLMKTVWMLVTTAQHLCWINFTSSKYHKKSLSMSCVWPFMLYSMPKCQCQIWILCGGVKEGPLSTSHHIYIIVTFRIKLIVALMDQKVCSVCLIECVSRLINIASFYDFMYTFVDKRSCTFVFNKLNKNCYITCVVLSVLSW